MTLSEIFTSIAQRMIKGIMIHKQFSSYYLFLGLSGYSRAHDYHFFAESKSYMELSRYYMCHHNKLIDEGRIENPGVIPELWYKYSRQDVDITTKKNAIKTGLEKWRGWEAETKQLYEQMYAELLGLGEISSAEFVKNLVCNVSDELKNVEKYLLNKSAIDYDMCEIINEQKEKKKHYSGKIECLMR